MYISFILNHLHNGEREGIKDGDGGLTFQRKDGPPLKSSDLYLMDSKESLIIFSCIILMPYADLRTRESDGDRGLAIQTIDGPPWQSSNSYPRTLKNLNYNLSCSIIFSCTLCFEILKKMREHMRQMMGVVAWPTQRGTGYHIHHRNHAQNLFHAHACVWFKSPKITYYCIFHSY